MPTYAFMTREEKRIYDSAMRDAVISLIGRGYRDPVGRCASAHLAIQFFGATEGDDPATSIDDLESPGRL